MSSTRKNFRKKCRPSWVCEIQYLFSETCKSNYFEIIVCETHFPTSIASKSVPNFVIFFSPLWLKITIVHLIDVFAKGIQEIDYREAVLWIIISSCISFQANTLMKQIPLDFFSRILEEPRFRSLIINILLR